MTHGLAPVCGSGVGDRCSKPSLWFTRKAHMDAAFEGPFGKRRTQILNWDPANGFLALSMWTQSTPDSRYRYYFLIDKKKHISGRQLRGMWQISKKPSWMYIVAAIQNQLHLNLRSCFFASFVFPLSRCLSFSLPPVKWQCATNDFTTFVLNADTLWLFLSLETLCKGVSQASIKGAAALVPPRDQPLATKEHYQRFPSQVLWFFLLLFIHETKACDSRQAWHFAQNQHSLSR